MYLILLLLVLPIWVLCNGIVKEDKHVGFNFFATSFLCIFLGIFISIGVSANLDKTLINSETFNILQVDGSYLKFKNDQISFVYLNDGIPTSRTIYRVENFNVQERATTETPKLIVNTFGAESKWTFLNPDKTKNILVFNSEDIKIISGSE